MKSAMEKVIRDIIYIMVYYILWKIAGFELTVIIGLGQLWGAIINSRNQTK